MKMLRSGLVFLLSLMVFITSSGMTVNLHYCAGNLQEVSFNSTAHHCNMQPKTATKPCAEQKNTSIQKPDTCCKNQHIVAKSDTKVSSKQKDESSFAKTFTFINHYFTSLFNVHADDEKEEDDKVEIGLFPMVKQGLYVLLQQFRN